MADGNGNAAARTPWLVSLAAMILVGGGGLGSHSLLKSDLGTRLDTQSEKLDGIKTTLTEVKVQVLAGERQNQELSANHSALVGRVSGLETSRAGDSEKLSELQRRVHELETRPK